MEIDNFVTYDGNISYEKFNNSGSFYRRCIEEVLKMKNTYCSANVNRYRDNAKG